MIRLVSWLGHLVAGLVVGWWVGFGIASLLHLGVAAHFLMKNAGAGLGLLVGLERWKGRRDRLNRTVHGSAQFATARQIKRTLVTNPGLIVGRENRRNGRLLRHSGPGHLLTIAPTRSGKGVCAIIPNLLTANQSVLCIDPKGESANITWDARTRFGAVHLLDPFGVTGRPGAGYNPLDRLTPGDPDLVDDAAVLADALVYDPPAHHGDAHWNEEARALITGLILHVVCSRPRHEQTLATVRELLSGSPHEFASLLAQMQLSPGADGLVRRAANRHLGKSDREAAGVLSSAQRHTHFLDSARINAAMARSDFRFADLKTSRCTVFLVLPPDRLDTYARWLRLLVAQAIKDLSRTPGVSDPPVLLLLDEFAALGRLEPVERAFGLMAGYGVQLWPILQDMHQLRGIYGERAGTFLSNAGLLQIFNVADVETAIWVSKSIGSTTVAYQTTSASTSQSPSQFFSSHSKSTSTHLTRCELMTPDEIMRLDPALELLLRPGEAPVVALKVRYFMDAEFRGLYRRG